ncbi:MAG: hypothetical protein PWR16_50 [Methanoculleus sp.]|nr:hypothetical protein [Methanoculleus sp.]
MTKAEVGIAVDRAEREGWNPGLSDGDCYCAVDPKAFFAVVLDVPEQNGAGVLLAERHGMVPVFGTARMYTKEIPDLPLDECYGVTIFETG